MKRLTNNIKVIMLVAITALLALIFLFVQNSQVYCAANAEQTASTGANNNLFFSDVVQPREVSRGERIFDAENSYYFCNEQLQEKNWDYPKGQGLPVMPTRNEEAYFLYATDSTGTTVKLNPVRATNDVWTNANAENYVDIRFEQVMELPSNVSFNDDAMTLNSYKLDNYFKVTDSSERIDTGIILYRSASSTTLLESARWNNIKLFNKANLSFVAPTFVEIAILYELREHSGFIFSNYHNCVALYFLNIAVR